MIHCTMKAISIEFFRHPIFSAIFLTKRFSLTSTAMKAISMCVQSIEDTILRLCTHYAAKRFA